MTAAECPRPLCRPPRPSWLVSLVWTAAFVLPHSLSPAYAAGLFEQDGFAVRMEIEALQSRDGGESPYEGEDVRLRFRVSEARTGGKPVSGLRPLAWLSKRDEGETLPDQETCAYQIRGFLAGRLARAADVNLNEYLLVTLDDNSSLSIIDPQVESSKTKTLGMVNLPGKGQDMVLAADRRHVLVTLPEQARVAVADILMRRASYVAVGGRPQRVRIQPDGRFAWVGDAEGKSVSCIDMAGYELRETFEAGAGPHEIEFRDDSRYVYIAGPGSAQLTVIDTKSLEVVARVPVGGQVTGLVYSAHSGKLYASLKRGREGEILAIDGDRHHVSGKIVVPYPVTGLAVSPNGRFGFALHRDDDRITIFDTATDKILSSVSTGPRPSHIQFSDVFAYVRQDGSGDVLLIHLAGLDRPGTLPQVTPVTMWQSAPEQGGLSSVAPLMALVPQGGGMFALSTGDRAIYHFVEGMNAPMGAYHTYPWPARGLVVVDRTITERGVGSYETEFRAPGAADYTVHFLVPSSPKLHGCFTMTFRSPPGKVVQTAMRVEPLFDGHTFTAGRPERLGVLLTDGDGEHAPLELDDVMILVLGGPTTQWRGAARPLGDGRYEAMVTFPKAGHYMVMVASRSRNVKFGGLPPASAWVTAPLSAPEVSSEENKAR